MTPQVRFSVEAEKDIDQIADHTASDWGPRQADRYLSQLEDDFTLLARNPGIGRPCDRIRKGLRRYEVGKHVVFYLADPDGILVVRVLHQRMLPANYF